MNIVFHAEGFDRADRRFAEMARRASAAQPAFGAMADDFHGIMDQAFATEGAIFGQRWRPLVPQYLERRQRQGRGSNILELLGGKGGRLRAALTGRSSKWSVRRVKARSLEIGTNLGIARVHQKGGVVAIPSGPFKPAVRIPARPFIGIRDSDRDRWARILSDWIVHGDVDRRLGL